MKFCPETETNVLYLDCLDCELKGQKCSEKLLRYIIKQSEKNQKENGKK